MAKNESATPDSSAVHDEMAKLREDLTTLRHDIGELASTVVSVGKGHASDVKDRTADELHEQLEKLQKRYEQAKSSGARTMHNVEHKVEEHPLTSVAIAFGVGLLAGHFMRRG